MQAAERVRERAVIHLDYLVHSSRAVVSAVGDVAESFHRLSAEILPHRSEQVYACFVLRDGVFHIAERLYNGLERVPGYVAALAEFLRHVLCVVAEGFKAFFSRVRAVDSADRKLLDRVADFIEVPRPILRAVREDREHIVGGKPQLFELHGILADIVKQLAGVVEAVLRTLRYVVERVLSSDAEVLHHRLSGAGGLGDVHIERVLQGVGAFSYLFERLRVHFAEVLRYFGNGRGDVVEILAEVVAVNSLYHLGVLFSGCRALACCSSNALDRLVEVVSGFHRRRSYRCARRCRCGSRRAYCLDSSQSRFFNLVRGISDYLLRVLKVVRELAVVAPDMVYYFSFGHCSSFRA